MRNKVVLVTGMAHGCGRVLAESFAAEGAKVVGRDVGRRGRSRAEACC
jgi:NAD(P)-dependent dehydrogenase (short-subunit alcohol dehydrogenase family)